MVVVVYLPVKILEFGDELSFLTSGRSGNLPNLDFEIKEREFSLRNRYDYEIQKQPSKHTGYVNSSVFVLVYKASTVLH